VAEEARDVQHDRDHGWVVAAACGGPSPRVESDPRVWKVGRYRLSVDLLILDTNNIHTT
jgi:hypothetical protein